MAPMRPDGTRDDVNGIREFNVGTGGGDGLALPTVAIHPNSQVRAAVYGVLKLSLYPDHYDWQFLPIPGQSFTDSGTQACHRAGRPVLDDDRHGDVRRQAVVGPRRGPAAHLCLELRR